MAAPAPADYHGAVSEFKRRLIETTLQAASGNRTHAARRLGLQRTYLLRLMRELRVAAPPPPERRRRVDEAPPGAHDTAAAPDREAPPHRAEPPPGRVAMPRRSDADLPGRSVVPRRT
jgi:hypothetical protein